MSPATANAAHSPPMLAPAHIWTLQGAGPELSSPPQAGLCQSGQADELPQVGGEMLAGWDEKQGMEMRVLGGAINF